MIRVAARGARQVRLLHAEVAVDERLPLALDHRGEGRADRAHETLGTSCNLLRDQPERIVLVSREREEVVSVIAEDDVVGEREIREPRPERVEERVGPVDFAADDQQLVAREDRRDCRCDVVGSDGAVRGNAEGEIGAAQMQGIEGPETGRDLGGQFGVELARLLGADLAEMRARLREDDSTPPVYVNAEVEPMLARATGNARRSVLSLIHISEPTRPY